MLIIGVKRGHDGAIACIENGSLLFSIEAEKDSGQRHDAVNVGLMRDMFELVPEVPDVVAIGGWHKRLPGYDSEWEAPYASLSPGVFHAGALFGRPVRYYTSSHERSHLAMAALSPSAPLEETAMLVWEGTLGALYHCKDFGRKIRKVDVLAQPGGRYASLFAIADPTFPDHGLNPRVEDSGKVMALAGGSSHGVVDVSVRRVVDKLMREGNVYPVPKSRYVDTSLYNCGVESAEFCAAARYLTDELFRQFYDKAVSSLPDGLPLVVAGGCGLNCEWNTRWRRCGFFSDVFIPPCADDSGAAIGTAVDAAVALGERPRIDWSVYSGAGFVRDVEPDHRKWLRTPLDCGAIASRLGAGELVAWVQGRCEIGPRALGHRSLLASPSSADMRDRLNFIKRRERYRPVAPCVLAEDLPVLFSDPIVDPYMLHFSHVETDRIPAATHFDGTSRVQAVTETSVPRLWELLRAFRSRRGVGVLCNTSLNFPGHGFINRTSDLFAYCATRLIENVVVEDEWYQLRGFDRG